MPRRPRILLADHPLHIVQRGINREPCFFADEDYLFYLHWLREGARKYGCAIHAYVLKTNHVHLLMTPSQPDSLARLMQSLGRRYAQYLNRTYRRSGSVWEGRYKSSLIQAEEYLLTCYRHIELNPLRADMVNDPSDYRWSSYRWHGLGLANDIISAHSLYHAMDADQAARCAEYRKLFRVELDTDAVAEIRASIQRCMPLGNETFRGQIETALVDRAGLKRRGRRPVTANEPIPGQLGLSL